MFTSGWSDWRRESSAELGERSDKLQRGARMPGQRRAGQLVCIYKVALCVCLFASYRPRAFPGAALRDRRRSGVRASQSRLTPAPWRVRAQRSVDALWNWEASSRWASSIDIQSGSQRHYPRSDRLNVQNPGEDRTSVFLGVLRKRQRAVAQRSPPKKKLLKKKSSFSYRHCFSDFSRAELEWLNHFQLRGRHFDWRGVPFVRRCCCGKVGEPFFVGLPSLCSIVHVTVTCGSAFSTGDSINVHRWNSIPVRCGEEALMMPKVGEIFRQLSAS